MIDQPDFAALARQYLDLWEDQLSAMAADPDLAEQTARFFDTMTQLGAIPHPMGASGLAAVWAKENTREEIFAALKRREVYATSGPRISVHFFGGWNFNAGDAMAPDLAAIGYKKGVPMGGDLSTAPSGKSPTFLLSAVKDPLGANLDRIQVIKGWLDSAGVTHFEGRARITDEHHVEVNNQIISAEKILVATGGWPRDLNHDRSVELSSRLRAGFEIRR